MKKFLLIITLYIAIPAYSLGAMEIPDIYITAEGNNKFEAQIKANKHGMQKVVLMIADKMGINYSDIGKVRYLKLKEVFTISSVTNEVSTESHYNATVKYLYDLYNINKLLRDYGTESVNDKFYEYLIFPIFKQRKVINIWDNNNDWSKHWIEARSNLEHNKFLYPKASNELMRKINSQNIFNLSYEDFLDIFQDRLLKKVMLVVCEYFTDMDTGKALVGVQFIILDYNDKKTTITKEYPLNNLAEVPHIIDKIITSTIQEYGHPDTSYEKNANITLDNIENTPDENYEDDKKTIIMSITVSDDNELAEVEKKLKNIKEIENLTITNDYDQKYKINAMTKSSEFALTESFYLNGLSYKKYGSIYRLINVQKGF
jgi:hypothetical protein